MAVSLRSSPYVQQCVQRFQRYVVSRHRSRARGGGGSTKPLIQAVADAILQDATAESGGAVDVEEVGRQMHVTVTVSTERYDHDGLFVPVCGGFEVTLFRPDASLAATLFSHSDDALQPRERFTLAHELGHTLFFTWPDADILPQRLIPRALGGFAANAREEGLCHDFARALLIPSTAAPSIGREGNVGQLSTLARRFETSREPVVRRILYDFRLWRSSVFYRCSIDRGKVVSKSFRGVDRRGNSDSAPTRPALEQMLSGSRSVQEIDSRLRTLGFRDVESTGSCVWIQADAAAGYGRADSD